MIIFGTTIKEKSLFFLLGEIHCTNCGQEVHLELIQQKIWFTLFFIPIFPMRTQYMLRCPLCLSGQRITKQDAHHIMEGNQTIER